MLKIKFHSLFKFYHRVTEEYKKNPGAVEAIAEQPGNQNHILIAYNRGLIVLWDRLNSVAVKVR
jgi:lethal(2) giant larvae protein